MVKLTSDLINSSMQRINPVRDRELSLRGKEKENPNIFSYFL
jgi:hypothetical protein